MISFDQALAWVRQEARLLEAEPVSLSDAVGRYLHHDLISTRDVPGFRNSAVDGYAVRVKECQDAAELSMKGVQAAGDPPMEAVEAGACVRVMTGGVVPTWADAVIPREETDESDGHHIRIISVPKSGANVRLGDEDVCAGSILRLSKRPLAPSDLGVLASIGKTTIPVRRRPVVSLLCTGGELLKPHETPRTGYVVNTNSICLAASLREEGALVTDVMEVCDDKTLLKQALLKVQSSDVILTTGGVSMGDFDHIKGLLPDMGMKVVFKSVAIKPGKPLMFALWGRTLVFALPGNPVSALVTYEVFVRPVIRRMLGCAEPVPTTVIAGEDFIPTRDKTHIPRVRIDGFAEGLPIVRLAGPQGSGILSSFSKSHGLVVVNSLIRKGSRLAMHWITGRYPWF